MPSVFEAQLRMTDHRLSNLILALATLHPSYAILLLGPATTEIAVRRTASFGRRCSMLRCGLVRFRPPRARCRPCRAVQIKTTKPQRCGVSIWAHFLPVLAPHPDFLVALGSRR